MAVNNSGAVIAAATVASPADTFDSTKSYYGMFDPLRCYTTDSNSFNYGSVKASLSAACGGTHWDGNFLNWLTQRKKEMIYQVLVGGKPIPAQANADGTANNLNGETKTGENGSTEMLRQPSEIVLALCEICAGRHPHGPRPHILADVGGAEASYPRQGRYLVSVTGNCMSMTMRRWIHSIPPTLTNTPLRST